MKRRFPKRLLPCIRPHWILMVAVTFVLGASWWSAKWRNAFMEPKRHHLARQQQPNRRNISILDAQSNLLTPRSIHIVVVTTPANVIEAPLNQDAMHDLCYRLRAVGSITIALTGAEVLGHEPKVTFQTPNKESVAPTMQFVDDMRRTCGTGSVPVTFVGKADALEPEDSVLLRAAGIPKSNDEQQSVLFLSPTVNIDGDPARWLELMLAATTGSDGRGQIATCLVLNEDHDRSLEVLTEGLDVMDSAEGRRTFIYRNAGAHYNKSLPRPEPTSVVFAATQHCLMVPSSIWSSILPNLMSTEDLPDFNQQLETLQRIEEHVMGHMLGATAFWNALEPVYGVFNRSQRVLNAVRGLTKSTTDARFELFGVGARMRALLSMAPPCLRVEIAERMRDVVGNVSRVVLSTPACNDATVSLLGSSTQISNETIIQAATVQLLELTRGIGQLRTLATGMCNENMDFPVAISAYAAAVNNHKTVVVPAATVTKAFSLSGWGPYLRSFSFNLRSTSLEKLVHEQTTRKFTVGTEVVWSGFCCGCCGFSNEIAQIIKPLSVHVRVRSTMGKNCHCPMERGQLEWFDRTAVLRGNTGLEVKLNASGTTQNSKHIHNPNALQVWVYHTDPVVSANVLVWPEVSPNVDVSVSRSMTEFTLIPPQWVHHLNYFYTEVWVPSTSCLETFARSGVKANLLRVVPEPLDIDFFNPARVSKLPSMPWMRYHFSSESHNSHGLGFGELANLKENFKFLSIFKWEPRKGWDVLLRAYFKAFTKNDPVTLTVIGDVWWPARRYFGVKKGKNAAKALVDTIKRTIAQPLFEDPAVSTRFSSLHDFLDQLPYFEVSTTKASEQDILRLYKSVDCFVLPSRGEGWGLPIIQAMAMELPTITTNFSGMTEFTNEEVAMLVPAKEVPVPGEFMKMYELMKHNQRVEDVPPYGWGEPDVDVLVQHMQHVAKLDRGHETLKALGRRARQHVVDHFSTEVVALGIVEELRRIEKAHPKRSSAENQ